jgi:hypothetical protein
LSEGQLLHCSPTLLKSVQRAQIAISAGGVGQARQMLESHGVAPGSEENLAKVEAMFSTMTEVELDAYEAAVVKGKQRLTEVFPTGYSGIRIFDRRTMTEVLDEMDGYAAACHSGLRVAVLKLAVRAGAGTALWTILNEVQEGRATVGLRRHVRTGRLLPLYKDKDNVKIRPVIIPSLLGRIYEKCAEKGVAVDTEGLRRHQLAVGVSGPAGRALAEMRSLLARNPGSVLVKFDYTNGYCAVSRTKVIEALLARKNWKGLAFFLAWNEDDPSVVFSMENGEHRHLQLRQGLDQGGACSPFLFAIAVEGVLKRLNATDGVFGALGYLDDVFAVYRQRRRSDSSTTRAWTASSLTSSRGSK